ncbi:MAG: formate dehydrogenase accessory sulfurtransferase FdhD [Micromonosporaceae bacterium]|nr:formate dehydrogenase accessory sulfurtransferase FdhD [Micromonosporaceae bacterium]
MGIVSDRRLVVRWTNGEQTRRPDTLVAEEPLEIRVNGRPLAVTMRTPGDDVDLALGFLVTEGLIGGANDVVTARRCGAARPDGPAPTDDPAIGGAAAYNVLDVTLAPHVPPPLVDPTRNFYTTSSCGVCGKASIDAVRTQSRHRIGDEAMRIDVAALAALPDRLRAAQRVFARTGGLHAAGLFTRDGDVVSVREDVGRHNTVDKVIGDAARQGQLPLRGRLLLVSGRASFELVQKASMAGIPMLAAVSAPSTLAVDLADESGMSLVGFLREGRMNIYTHPHRVNLG